MAADVGQEELEAVGRPDENLRLRRRLLLVLLDLVVLLDRLADLEADALNQLAALNEIQGLRSEAA